MTDKIQLKGFTEFLNESVDWNKVKSGAASVSTPTAKDETHVHLNYYPDIKKSNEKRKVKVTHAEYKKHSGSYRSIEESVDLNEDVMFEVFESLFEDHLLDNSHLSNAHAHLQAGTNHLKAKDVDGFHNSMAAYHTNMAKHHNKSFDHHLDQEGKMRAANRTVDADRHAELAWGHSEAYDHHKRLGHAHSSYLKKKTAKGLKEEVQSDLDSLLESLSPEATAGAAKQQADNKDKAAEEASNLVDNPAAKTSLKEDVGAAPAASNSSTGIASKDILLGPLRKRKSAINEAKIPGGNPATVPPAAPSMSKSNDSLPSKRKSLGKLKESEELNEDAQMKPEPNIESDHHSAAQAHKKDGNMKAYHSSMAAHHQAVADHYRDKSTQTQHFTNEHSIAAKADKHEEMADMHDQASRKAKMNESLDPSLLEDIQKAASYASVAAKHKFTVKGPNQTHIFNHGDHGKITVNRENDSWTHNTVSDGVRQKGTETHGKGSEALDRHLRHTATGKQVHI